MSGQDGLGAPVAALLGGAAGGFALDQEDLRLGRVLLLAVRELAGQARGVERALAARHLAGLAGRFARAGGVDDLEADGLGVRRALEQEFAELLRDRGLDRPLHLGRDQLVLGLGRELRVRHLDREDRRHALARVVARELDVLALGEALFLDELVDFPGQRGPEARQVRAAVLLRDVVRVAVHRLLVGVVPLRRDLDRDRPFLVLEIEDVRVDRRAAAVQVLHEGGHAALVLEHVALVLALVDELHAHARVQERELPQALGEPVVGKRRVREDRVAGLEADRRAPVRRRADDRERPLGLAHLVLLAVKLAVARDGERQRAGKRIHDGNADAVQAARDLVGVVVEFSAGVQHGHDDLGCRAVFFRVDVGRDAAAVVDHRHRLVRVDRHDDAVAVARQRLVDRVVDDLENHVVKARAVIGVADVHAGPFADGLEALQHLDFGGVVGVVLGGPGACLHKPEIIPEKPGFLLCFSVACCHSSEAETVGDCRPRIGLRHASRRCRP